MSSEESTKKKGGKLKWIIIAVLVIGVIAAIANGNNDPKKISSENSTAATSEAATADGSSTAAASTEAEDTHFGIGDTADFNGVQVKLASAILSKGDGKFVKPDDGKYFLELIFEINNQSSDDLDVSSALSFEAYCDDFSLNQDILGQQAKEVDGISQLDGSVVAGKKMKGVISYQVPKDFSNFDISFSPHVWGSKKVTFQFGRGDVDASSIK